jgi:hypothetical protein
MVRPFCQYSSLPRHALESANEIRHWTFYFMLIWTATALAAMTLFVPETYRPVLLRRRVKKLRRDTGDDRYHIVGGLVPKKSVPATILWSLRRPIEMLLFEPMCLNLCLHSSLLLGILYLFFGAFPLIFTTNHGFNLWQVGLTFLGLAVGILFGISTTPYWQRDYEQMVHKQDTKTDQKGQPEPEFRLPQVMLGSVLVTVGLFWFAFTTYSSVHWIVPIIASGVFGMGYCISLSN